jgi:hypothetical protein
LDLSTDYTDYTDGRSAVTEIGPAPALRAGGEVERRDQESSGSAMTLLISTLDLADIAGRSPASRVRSRSVKSVKSVDEKNQPTNL